jgi:hypothetical protein
MIVVTPYQVGIQVRPKLAKLEQAELAITSLTIFTELSGNASALVLQHGNGHSACFRDSRVSISRAMTASSQN